MKTYQLRPKPSSKNPDKVQKKISAILSAAVIDPKSAYTDQVFTILRDVIIQGKFLPGTTLSEAIISNAIGVSRTPVREALRMLALRNLVEIYPQAGTVVAPVKMSLLSESKFIRCALESENAAELARSITPQQVNELKGIIKLQEKAILDEQRETILKHDDNMHKRLFEFMNRIKVWELVETVKVHMDRVRYLLIEKDADHSKRIIQEHQEILKHLADHNPEGVSAAIHNHINLVIQDIISLKKNAPADYFSD
jgi:GntR family transcriptional regulator, rspAB operon transcriptional repressor